MPYVPAHLLSRPSMPRGGPRPHRRDAAGVSAKRGARTSTRQPPRSHTAAVLSNTSRTSTSCPGLPIRTTRTPLSKDTPWQTRKFTGGGLQRQRGQRAGRGKVGRGAPLPRPTSPPPRRPRSRSSSRRPTASTAKIRASAIASAAQAYQARLSTQDSSGDEEGHAGTRPRPRTSRAGSAAAVPPPATWPEDGQRPDPVRAEPVSAAPPASPGQQRPAQPRPGGHPRAADRRPGACCRAGHVQAPGRRSAARGCPPGRGCAGRC